MKAAVVSAFESPPKYQSFDVPVPAEGETEIMVRASALSPLAKAQAKGGHYSSVASFPFVPGVDGVGTLGDGKRVYFAFPKKPYGAMAERVAVGKGLFVVLPEDLDDITAAAIANPGMSSWAALTERAKLVHGETVLVNGATGSSGRLAIQIAKHLGAKTVIATGRNEKVLETLKALGADLTISLALPPSELEQSFREHIRVHGVSVVLDYLWGPSAEAIIGAVGGGGAASAEPRIRFVQIGSISSPTITMPGGILRSSGLELIGSGLGSISYQRLVERIGELLSSVRSANLRIMTKEVPLRDVESEWNRDFGESRLVFTM